MNARAKRKSDIIVIPFVLLFLLIAAYSYYVVHNAGDHNYFPELQEFSIRTTDAPTNPQSFPAYSMQAKYIGQDIVIDSGEYKTQKTAYIFQKSDTNAPVYLLIPPGIADHINLNPNETYDIVYEINYGWPTTTGLMISRQGKLVFAGISDWNANKTVKLAGLLPVTVNQTSILTGHYIKGTNSDPWVRKTNTEITFTLGGNSAILHQGESASLGGYDITLLIARETQYQAGWLDAGQNGISYIIASK